MASFTREWVHAISDVINYGENSSPRGNGTKEVTGAQIAFDMNNPVLCIPERQLGTAFLCYEPFWILSGDNRLQSIKPFAPMMERFSDDGEFLSGAYGPKIIDQFPYIIKAFEKDINTRQAIINIWREKPNDTKDCPCTCMYQFLIRNDLLHLIVYMRSNDLYLGTPYDVFTQSMVALGCCLLLRKRFENLTLGSLTLNVGSLHIYDENYLKMTTIQDKYYTHPDKDALQLLKGHPLKFDYNMSFEDLKEYLHECAKNLANDLPVGHCFLKGLLPKGACKGVFK